MTPAEVDAAFPELAHDEQWFEAFRAAMGPPHQVRLTGFEMATTPVTQAQCEGDSSWDAARMDRSANGYRLPTEAEWEFAARGGNESQGYVYAGSDEVDEVTWYWRNSGDEYLSDEWDWDAIVANKARTHPVASKVANELGLYDMSALPPIGSAATRGTGITATT